MTTTEYLKIVDAIMQNADKALRSDSASRDLGHRAVRQVIERHIKDFAEGTAYCVQVISALASEQKEALNETELNILCYNLSNVPVESNGGFKDAVNQAIVIVNNKGDIHACMSNLREMRRECRKMWNSFSNQISGIATAT